MPPVRLRVDVGSLGQRKRSIAVLATVMLGGSDDLKLKLIWLYIAPCSRKGEIRPTTLQYDLKNGSLSVTFP